MVQQKIQKHHEVVRKSANISGNDFNGLFSTKKEQKYENMRDLLSV